MDLAATFVPLAGSNPKHSIGLHGTGIFMHLDGVLSVSGGLGRNQPGDTDTKVPYGILH